MTKFADVPLIDLATLARGGVDAAHELLVVERACAREGFFRLRDNAGIPGGLVKQNFELDRILWGSLAEQLATLVTDPSRDLSGRGIETKGARTLDIRVTEGKTTSACRSAGHVNSRRMRRTSSRPVAKKHCVLCQHGSSISCISPTAGLHGSRDLRTRNSSSSKLVVARCNFSAEPWRVS